jgi:HK97 gp10 family phage protein
MAESFTIKVQGFAEFDRRLREFGPKLAANGLRAANYAAAKVFIEAARANIATGEHPYQSGFTKSHIVAFRRRTTGRNLVTHSVGIRGIRRKYANTRENRRRRRVGKAYQADGPAFYARFVEFGSSRQKARPFLRPAFIDRIDAAIAADRERLALAVERAAKR